MRAKLPLAAITASVAFVVGFAAGSAERDGAFLQESEFQQLPVSTNEKEYPREIEVQHVEPSAAERYRCLFANERAVKTRIAESKGTERVVFIIMGQGRTYTLAAELKSD